MFFYDILLNKRIPSEVLTYKFEIELEQGRLVKVPIRNKLCFGIVVRKIEQTNFETDKIKTVTEILPYTYNQNQFKLIKIIAQNTFNATNIVFDAFLQPLKLLTKKDWNILDGKFEIEKNLNLQIEKTQNVRNLEKSEFFVEKDILVRIIYIIRSQINIIIDKHLINQQILILFPEKKLLDKIFSSLKLNSEFDKLVLENNLDILSFSGDVSAKSKSCVKEILAPGNNSTQIIFGTRSSLFLPFTNLIQIVVVDESNSFYIQEQNSLYYDARDIAFLISSTLMTKLDFVSTLPSGRLYNFYSKELLTTNLTLDTKNNQKPLKIQISERNSKSDAFSLFSDNVELAITGNDTNIGFFENAED